MLRVWVLLFVYLGIILAPARALACAGHMYFNPDNMGFLGGAVVRMAGLAPPKPVFDLRHIEMTKASIGEKSEIEVQFARPYFSKDVRLKARGTDNIDVLRDEFPLKAREGVVKVPFRVTGSGFETITLTVTGEHKGETVQEYGRIYVSVRAPKKGADEELRVSGRE